MQYEVLLPVVYVPVGKSGINKMELKFSDKPSRGGQEGKMLMGSLESETYCAIEKGVLGTGAL